MKRQRFSSLLPMDAGLTSVCSPELPNCWRMRRKEIHRELVRQIQDLGRQLDDGKAGVTMEVMNFLMDWLQNHIMKVDRNYVSLLEGKKLVS